jgi:hypothetical protein
MIDDENKQVMYGRIKEILDKHIEHNPEPNIRELATRMRDSLDYCNHVLAFITIICSEEPRVLEAIATTCALVRLIKDQSERTITDEDLMAMFASNEVH